LSWGGKGEKKMEGEGIYRAKHRRGTKNKGGKGGREKGGKEREEGSVKGIEGRGGKRRRKGRRRRSG